MHKDLCRNVTGLCDAMRPTKGADLLKYLRKVNFIGKHVAHIMLTHRSPAENHRERNYAHELNVRCVNTRTISNRKKICYLSIGLHATKTLSPNTHPEIRFCGLGKAIFHLFMVTFLCA